MEQRLLGSTGLSVSRISLGMWQLSGPVQVDGRADGFPDIGRREAIELIHAAAELGITCVDTAPIYGGGEGERRLGEALRGRRDRFIVSTKMGMDVTADGARRIDTSPAAIATSLEASLRRLETDYVDVLLYHAAPKPDEIHEGREALEALKRAGKLRAYGISVFGATELQELTQRGATQVVMLEQSLHVRPTALLKLALRHRLGVMVRGALASGLLSGRHFGGATQFTQDDIRSRFWISRDYELMARLAPPGMSYAAFALRYVLDQPTTDTLVLGGRTIEHYREAARVAAGPSLGMLQHQLIDGFGGALRGYRAARSTAARIVKEKLRPARGA